MKKFNKIAAIILVFILGVFVCANLYMIRLKTNDAKEYRVEISRASKVIDEGGIPDISGYKYLTGIERCNGDDDFYTPLNNYEVREIKGELYRFDYISNTDEKNGDFIWAVNAFLGIMTVLIIGILIYVRIKVLEPFHKLSNIPYELSKGNLTSPVKENKNKFFGKFTWGLDLLRENLEESKRKELELHKERKTLLLSLSHDIKTPLSAIKLYSQALSKGLYKDPEKHLEISENINAKADEIEKYLSQIISASHEDFIDFEVKEGEFYFEELMGGICGYYGEKLSLVKINFEVEEYGNCLISGDLERCIEVLQNIIENAVKYGGDRIEISFEDEDGCRLIYIKNNGCTLLENEIVHIFDSFWRGSNSSGVNGSGLGLYICRQLMHKINGDIFAAIKGEYLTIAVVLPKA